MKHQKELIEKYKHKQLFTFPFPMFIIKPLREYDQKECLYLVDLLSFPYYIVFLLRYKFPIVAYELDEELREYKYSASKLYHQTKVDKHPKLNKFATRISPIAGVLGMFIHQLFPDIIDPIILPLLSIPTPHGYFYTMMVLLIVTLFVLYGIIKRNNELKQALKKDGVRKVKIRISKRVQYSVKQLIFCIATFGFMIYLSLIIFKLPKDMFSILLSIPLSFLSAYIWWYLISLPYFDTQSIEILEELEY